MEAAIERVMAGPEKKSRVMSESEKKLVSYHEAGHAVVSLLFEACRPGTPDQHHSPGRCRRLYPAVAGRGQQL